MVQIFAALRAQALAFCAARDLQGQRQKDLLTQNVFQQDTFALIIADLCFRVRDRKLVASGVSAQGPIKQLKISRDVLVHRFETAGALQLNPGRQTSSQAYVFNYLVFAVMLLDHFGVPGRFQRSKLASFASQVDDIRPKLLLEIQRMKFQIFNVEEHGQLSAAIAPTTARGSTPRGVSTARSKT
jgi:hypothetical protein